MKSATKDKVYKSPVRKLARFFEKSRDQWQAKCREAKAMVKRLKNRARFLKESRDRWKSQAKELQAKVAQMEAARCELLEELEALRQKESQAPVASGGLEQFALVPRHHQYSVGHVMLFPQGHHETCFIYDIKHKTAAVLKRELQGDETWVTFTRLAAQTKRSVQQTSLASLAPPNQRTKARYMNVDVLIQGAQNTLTFLDQQQTEPSPAFDPQQVQDKLGWITRFRQPLEEWAELLQLAATTESFVRQQGLYHDAHWELKEHLQPLAYSTAFS